MILVVCGALLVLFLIHELYWKRRNLPPGPTPLPIAGNMVSVSQQPPYESTLHWRRKYGPFWTQWLGQTPAIIIAEYELMKETVIKDGDKYADRYTTETLVEFRGGSYGVGDTNGDLWREMRRFTLHTLKDFGMGKSLMEFKILSEAAALSKRLAKNGQNVAPQWEFDLAVGSVINNVLFGYRFDERNEDKFRELKEVMNRHFQQVASFPTSLAIMQKWTRVFPPIQRAVEKMYANRDALFGFFRKQSLMLKAKIDFDSAESETLVECFLKEQKKRENEPECGGYCMNQLDNVLLDLWVAGMESTSNTLTWGVAFILNNPEVQSKIHEELDLRVEPERQITMADKPKLPYIMATVNEVQRLANILPQNLFRRTTEDVKIRGYHIPKGTLVIPQISAVMFDEKVFPEPKRFKPERFLNSDGTLRKVDELVPFSVGKRQCPGESLARMELFLFIANLFREFEVSASELPSLQRTATFTMAPKPFKCDFVRRK